MAFGLGNFFSDLIGQENIDAAKNAFNNSRAGEAVDNVSQAASDTYKDLSYTANSIGDSASRGLGDVQEYAAQKARELEAYRQENMQKQRDESIRKETNQRSEKYVSATTPTQLISCTATFYFFSNQN